jgi:hypothetical protein
LGEDVDQAAAVVSDTEVRGGVPLDLGFAPAERDKHGENEEFRRRHVEAGAREVVAEAIGRQIVLDVALVVRRRGVEAIDDVGADDLPLDRQALAARSSGVVVDCPGSGSSTPRSFKTSFVACRKSNTLAMPT